MQPREDCCNRAYGAAQEFEASPEVHRLPCLAQPISQSAGKFTWTISAYEEDGEIHLDYPSKRGIPRAQAHAIHCTDPSRPNGEGADDAVYCGNQSGGQCSHGGRASREGQSTADLETSILHQRSV